jgi:hypothetical protein
MTKNDIEVLGSSKKKEWERGRLGEGEKNKTRVFALVESRVIVWLKNYQLRLMG